MTISGSGPRLPQILRGGALARGTLSGGPPLFQSHHRTDAEDHQHRRRLCAQADGQLNALVIPEAGNEAFSWISYDDCPVKTALDRQEEGRDPVVSTGPTTTWRCWSGERNFPCAGRRPRSRTLEVPTKYLRRQGDRNWCEDISDYRLGVEPGCALHCGGDQPGLSLARKTA